jgi:hypothetical protein
MDPLGDKPALGAHVAVMRVGIAYEGHFIPLAWCCYRANDSESYPEAGQVELIMSLLNGVKAGIPPQYQVLVLADRGIGTSPDLCRKVDALGWQYRFRSTKQSKIITAAGGVGRAVGGQRQRLQKARA